ERAGSRWGQRFVGNVGTLGPDQAVLRQELETERPAEIVHRRRSSPVVVQRERVGRRSIRAMFWDRVILLASIILLGCTASPMRKYDLDVPAQTMGGLDAPEVQDGRARFREMFCAALQDSPNPRQRSCEELLHRLIDEAPSAAPPAALPPRDTRLRFVFVTGLFNDCASVVALPFETAVPHLQSLGYEAEILIVSGRSSSASNADDIAEFVSKANASDQRLVLVGYSKGAVDILDFLVAYPELAKRIRAVVSVAGAI